MRNHFYPELKPRTYLTLKNANIDQIRSIFRFRTRMANFGDNYKNRGDLIMCPLCHNHFDSQILSFQCTFYKDKLDINCDMKDIDTENITLDTARTVTEMMRLREEYLKESQVPDEKHDQ